MDFAMAPAESTQVNDEPGLAAPVFVPGTEWENPAPQTEGPVGQPTRNVDRVRAADLFSDSY